MSTISADHSETAAPRESGDAPPAVPVPAVGSARSFHGTVSRTWELELIISGAVLYGLFHLPGVADGWLDRTLPLLSRQLGMLALLGGFLAKSTAYVLIACFVLHLCARAYWVGLIGLDSVFPHGIRWEATRYGPMVTRLYRRNARDLPATIARLDDLCSILFSLGFLLAFGLIYAMLFAAVGLLVAGAVSRIFFDGQHLLTLFYALGAIVFVPYLVLSHLDRRLGGRLSEGRWYGRAAERVMRVSGWLMGISLTSGVMLTLSTNLRHRRFQVGLQVASMLVVLVIMADFMVRLGDLRVSSQAYIPAVEGAGSVSPQHYESLRSDRERLALVPTIQSDVVEDPYLKLFIPYRTERHNAAFAALCPGVPQLTEPGLTYRPERHPLADEHAAAVLRCAAEIHAVTLNGVPAEEVQFQFFTHPGSGLPGFLAYIPTEDLPRGRNEVGITPAPHVDAARPAPDPYRIPFWR